MLMPGPYLFFLVLRDSGVSRTHSRANKSILFVEILHPHEVTMTECVQIKYALLSHVYKA